MLFRMHISRLSISGSRLSFIIALIVTLFVFITMPDYGISQDEPFYLSMGEANASWLLQPSLKTIDAHWPIHDRHPPLVKIIGGLTYLLFTKQLGIMDAISSFRLGILPFVFLLSWSMTWYVSKTYDKWLGIFSGFSVIFIPRVFFHSHIAALDFPITSLWFTTVVVTPYALTSFRAFCLTIMLLGASYATKLQGAFLGGTVIMYLTFWNFVVISRKKFQKNEVMVFIIRTLLLITVPLILFVIIWPYLWPSPFQRFEYYVRLMLDHYPIETYYLGRQYTNFPGNEAPWHYPFIIFFSTLPLGILIPAVIGIVLAVFLPRKNERFFAFNMFVPLLMMALPQAIRYDGERLFLPAYPFAVLMAAAGIWRLRVTGGRYRNVYVLIPIVLAVYTIYSSLRIHPYQYVYSGEVIGGVSGAHVRGYETEYWGTSYKSVLPFIREHPDATYCIFPWPELLKGYWTYGLVKEMPVKFEDQSIVYSGDFSSCDYLLMLSRQGFFYVNPYLWEYYRNEKPVFSERIDGVPLVAIYSVAGEN